MRSTSVRHCSRPATEIGTEDRGSEGMMRLPATNAGSSAGGLHDWGSGQHPCHGPWAPLIHGSTESTNAMAIGPLPFRLPLPAADLGGASAYSIKKTLSDALMLID